MGVSYLSLAAASTAASLAGLQWWASSRLGADAAGQAVAEAEGPGAAAVGLGQLLESPVAIALVVNSVVNIYLLVVLSLKSLFFQQLYLSETRKMLERMVNYLLYKGTFLPLVVPSNLQQLVIWSGWLVLLCSLKMLQSLAKDRLERLNASPLVTPSRYFRVYSALLLVLSTDLLWMKLCLTIYRSFNAKLFLLLFFEPLSVAFETCQAIMIYGFQLFDIWQRDMMDSGEDFLEFQKSYKKAAGSFVEWRGRLIRNCGFILDILTLSTTLCHYLMIWWLRGMAFHLADAILVLNLRALFVSMWKRVRTYIKLRKALGSLDCALPDATYDELCAFDDECAICRGPMARAKKLPCNHLFHLACLRSWLDQGLAEVYSCPTCRRPLLNSSQGRGSSAGRGAGIDQQIAEQINLGNQQRQTGLMAPQRQPNPSDAIWSGLDPGWVQPWPNPGIAGPSSSTIRSVGLTGVQMMMRQLASVGENYGHGGDATWHLWPSHTPSSSVAPAHTARPDAPATPTAGLRLRGASSPGTTPEVLAMVDRVREVLPHIPDELIIQDLVRTNNINATVNNLLLMQ